MTTIRYAAAVLLALSGNAFAQTSAPATSPTTAPTAQSTPAVSQPPGGGDLTKDGKPRMKVVRAQCRTEVKGQNLKGEAGKQAMAACIIKQRPDMEARVKCRMDPSLKGMDKAARKAAVSACVAKTKG